MVSVFPSTPAHFIHQQPGTQVEAIGNALEVKLCKPILNYRIVTTQRIKSTCYPPPYQLNSLIEIRLIFENI